MSAARVELAQPLRSVLLMAFRLKDYQLSAPTWVNGLFVEILATMPVGATVQQVPEMLRNLLDDRFGLRVHSETRQIEAYQLVVATGGIKMKEVMPLDEFDKEFPKLSTSSGQARPDRISVTPERTVRTVVIPRGRRYVTNQTLYELESLNVGTVLNATRMSVPELVGVLTLNLGEPVIDLTGLQGIYQFRIEIPPDAEVLANMPQGFGEQVRRAGLSTFRAVESLGLKLERRRTPVEVVVVDSINRAPTPN